jgi:hypothetical protein
MGATDGRVFTLPLTPEEREKLCRALGFLDAF